MTAYHPYLLGKLGSFINQDWFVLDSSSGLETDDLKTYMRFTVILSEILFYIPAVMYFTKWVGKHRNQSPIGQFIAAAAILFQPSLMLIDHGHFQYNSVMLGLTVYAINNLMHELYGPAAACFVLSICFKQVALYYSPIFFGYLLSRSLFKIGVNIPRLLYVTTATVSTFFTIFLPLYIGGGGVWVEASAISNCRKLFNFIRILMMNSAGN